MDYFFDEIAAHPAAVTMFAAQNTASGVSGEPTARVICRGGPENRNSASMRSAASGLGHLD
jgi:hypothetical protein